MSDVLLSHTEDGGEINILNGLVEVTDTMETAVYLSLFGGTDWWGNLDEATQFARYIAQTGGLVSGLAWTSPNLVRIRDAVLRDLRWLTAGGYATLVEVEVTVPELDNLLIEVRIDTERYEFSNRRES